MRSALLNLARIIIIVSSITLVFWAARKSWETISLIFASAFFKDFFTRGVTDPLFGTSTAQDWVIGLFKSKPDLPGSDLPKFDI